ARRRNSGRRGAASGMGSTRRGFGGETGEQLDHAHRDPGENERDDGERRRLVGAVGPDVLHVDAKAGRLSRLAMVNSPMTMASVRKAPDSSATMMLGKMTLNRIVGVLAPRMLAASVSVCTSIVLRPVSTARYMEGRASAT